MRTDIRSIPLLLCLAGCDVEEPVEAGETAVQPASIVAASPAAREAVAEVRAAFMVRTPESLLPEPSAPAPVLGASTAEDFVVDDGAMIPRLAADAAAPAVAVRLPLSADDAIHLVHGQSSLSAAVRLRGAEAAAAEVADGTIHYPAALAGADVFVRTTAVGVEDYVHFAGRPAEESLTYDLELGDEVAGLRLVGDTLELLDAGGVPRLRMAPPYAVDRAGTMHPLRVDVAGCAVDTDPVPSYDRPFVRLDRRACEVHIDWADAELSYPLLVDPAWGSTNAMATARAYHTSATLPGGRVIVVGGSNPAFLASAEIWNPITNVWTATSSMTTARRWHAMSAITSGSNTYLVVSGGHNAACPGNICSAAERYNVSSGLWSSAGSTTARFVHASSTTTQASPRVLVTGGITVGATVLNTGELYDPVSNTWAPTVGNMQHPRYGHTSTALSSAVGSKVILVGGFDAAGAVAPVAATEKFNVVDRRFYAGPNTESRVAFHTSTLIPGADWILIAGGQVDSAGNCSRVAGRYVGSTDTYGVVKLMGTARCHAAASVLDSLKVIVTGGHSTVSGAELGTAELYDWGTNTWTTSFMPAARAYHTAALYPSAPASKVLVPGGTFGMGGGYHTSADIYTP